MQQWKLKSAIYAPLIMAKTVQQYLTSSKVSLLPPCCIIVDHFLHSDVVIEQLTKDTAQVSTVTITEMEIKICNLHAQ